MNSPSPLFQLDVLWSAPAADFLVNVGVTGDLHQLWALAWLHKDTVVHLEGIDFHSQWGPVQFLQVFGSLFEHRDEECCPLWFLTQRRHYVRPGKPTPRQ